MPIHSLKTVLQNSSSCAASKFWLITDWRTLQRAVAAALVIGIPLKYRLYWETQGEGGWWAKQTQITTHKHTQILASFKFGFLLHLQTNRTPLTGLSTWWRGRTLTQGLTQTPLWVNPHSALAVNLHINDKNRIKCLFCLWSVFWVMNI